LAHRGHDARHRAIATRMLRDALQEHDRAVDRHPEGERQPRKRHQVDPETGGAEEKKGEKRRTRHGAQDRERCAQALHRQQQHDEDRDDASARAAQERLQLGLDALALVVDHFGRDIRRKLRGHRFQRAAHVMGDAQDVRARFALQHDLHGRIAVDAGQPARLAPAIGDARHVADRDRVDRVSGHRTRAQRFGTRIGPYQDHRHALGSGAHGAQALAAADTCDRSRDRLGGHLAAIDGALIDVDVQLALAAAVHLHRRNPGHGRQPRRDRVFQQLAQGFGRARATGAQDEEATTVVLARLRCRDHGRCEILGQRLAQCPQALAQEDLGAIHARAALELDPDLCPAEAAHRTHVGDAAQLLRFGLDLRRDQRLHRLGRRVRPRKLDHELRLGEIGCQRQRQPVQRVHRQDEKRRVDRRRSHRTSQWQGERFHDASQATLVASGAVVAGARRGFGCPAIQWKMTGTTSRVRIVDTNKPPITVVASDDKSSAPVPKKIGTSPRIVVSVVIQIGR
jgi:hypothetical protein